nr:valine--tRNA ligase [Pyrinomonadaceae bacterium]
MRREGASVDWSRQRFTMDESLSLAVRNVFCTLYDEGWVYRGLRIVNWCPKDKTVLSDLEVKEETKKDGKLYYLRYPISGSPPYEGGGAAASADGVVLSSGNDPDKVAAQAENHPVGETPTPLLRKEGSFLVVATTRPETMLGDTAVAVNPSDDRYRDLVGKAVALPLARREIPIVADEYVDAEFGTGAVKVTPAHDPNDYQIGQRHDLEQLLVMNDDGTMNAAAGEGFEGLDRFAAREKVVAMFDELGLLEKIEDYEQSLPVCERCKTIVEPILSEQWFVKMDELRDLALGLMSSEGVPHFSPQVPHEKVYTSWLENLKDWTISRQLWWGHQIPAWYDGDGNVYVARTEDEAIEKSGGKALRQDQDVLDTWFSSGLWAFSTLGWTGSPVQDLEFGVQGSQDDMTLRPERQTLNDLSTFLPTDVLVTGRDIIFLWVSRMIMLTRKFTGKKAFEDVVVTGTVLGKDGKPMSKSRNNGVDPIEMFDKFGVDATRIYLASIATGADIKWNDVGVETYRNFANKIWNATRFCLMNAEGNADAIVRPGVADAIVRESEPLADRWIISKLNRTALGLNAALDRYEFHTAVSLLYHFFWDDFCDWYIELKKDELADGGVRDPDADDGVRVPAATRILTVLEIALRMLHPFMPYLTEELWQKLPGTNLGLHHSAYRNPAATAPGSDMAASIMLTKFPPGDASAIDERAESEMSAVIDVIKRVRNIRTEMQISPSIKFDVHVAANPEFQQVFRDNEAQILKLARAEKLVISDSLDVPKASAKAVTTDARVAVPLEGLIDFDKERGRLSTQIAKLTEEKSRLDGQLSNANFVERAPAEKVEALRERQAELTAQIGTLKTNLDALN